MSLSDYIGITAERYIHMNNVKEAIKRIKKRLCPELIEELEGGLAMFKKEAKPIYQDIILRIINEEMGKDLI